MLFALNLNLFCNSLVCGQNIISSVLFKVHQKLTNCESANFGAGEMESKSIRIYLIAYLNFCSCILNLPL